MSEQSAPSDPSDLAHPPVDHPTPEPASPTGSLGPVEESRRIFALDVLRGFAILGIFTVNIVVFAKPLPSLLGKLGDPDGSRTVDFLVSWLSELKFMGLFALLFGMGLILQRQRADAAGRPFTGLYIRRLIVLLLVGLAHALLLWYGDILFMYAIAGTLLLAFHWCRPAALGWIGGGLFAAGGLFVAALVLIGTIANSMVTTPPPDETPTAEAVIFEEPSTPVQHLLNDLNAAQWDVTSEGWADAERRAYGEGPMSVTLTMRAITWGGLVVIYGIVGGAWLRIFGLFFFGAAIMKSGFFEARNAHWHRRAAIIGLSVGLPFEAIAAWMAKIAGEGPADLMVMWSGVLHYFTSLFLCVGYLGAMTMFANSNAARWLATGLAAVGRMALTNYLGQTIIATSIFYWWGLGLFDTVGRWEQIGMVFGIYAVQMVGSVLWLKVFRMGPFEWVWRTLIYLKPAPLLRR